MNSLLKISILSVFLLGSTNVFANEIGLDYKSYETGSGMRYHGSFDLPYLIKLNASFEKLNTDKITLLKTSEDYNADLGLLKYGLGFEYIFDFELGAYAEFNKVSLDIGSVTYNIHNGTDRPTIKEIELDNIDGMDYKVGINYKFLDFYEIDIGARNIEYDDIEDSVTSAEASFSFYFNPYFKVIAHYSSDSFLNESSYGLGLSYDF